VAYLLDDSELDAIRLALRQNIGRIAEELLGEQPSSRNGREWRWRSSRSFSVKVSGPKMGACADFRDGWVGDPFGLIMRERVCSFLEALEWASARTGVPINRRVRTEPQGVSAVQKQALERERRRARQEAEEAADQASRIAKAREFWSNRLPDPIGSIGEKYLVNVRGIPIRPSQWPSCVGVLPPGTVGWYEDGPDAEPIWHSVSYAGAVIVAATAPNGEVTAVQRIFLAPDAHNLRYVHGKKAKVKLTKGVSADIGAVVRLPGAANGPLLLCEGPETGLSVWAATQHETWIALGSISNHRPPLDRQVVVCRDDDPSSANRALASTISQWRRDGAAITVATPWQERRHDKTDFNDVLRAEGVTTVRARIALALSPPVTVRRLSIEEARPETQRAISRFFDAAATWDPEASSPPPVFAVRTDVGSGKSREARRRAAMALSQRDPMNKQPIVMMVPTHVLGEEAAAAFEAQPEASKAGLKAAIWRGREAPNPLQPGSSMCLDLDRVHDAMNAGSSIETACCKSKSKKCPFYDTCGYQAQKRLQDQPSLWFVAHEGLFHAPPEVLGKPATLIVDESMFDAGLSGHHGRHITLSIDSLEGCGLLGLDGQHLRHLRDLALTALRIAPGGPIERQAMLAAGLTADHAASGSKLEWLLKVDPKLHPEMTAKERKEAVRVAAGNLTVRRLVMFWRAMADLLRPDGPEHSGWASIAWERTKEGDVRVIRLKGRQSVHDKWRVPTLLLDATLDIDLVKPYWPTVEQIADIKITTPHQTVIQVADKTYAKGRFDLSKAKHITHDNAEDDLFDDGDSGEKHLSDQEIRLRTARLRGLNATIGAIARGFAPGRTVAVVQKTIREALPTVGVLPPYVDLAHHNALAGIDAYKHHVALIVVGRTAPPPAAVERIAETLTGRAVEHIQGWYPKTAIAREMADGTPIAAETDQHPDLICEAIRRQTCEDELVQIIGRVRGGNRKEADPVTVVVMTNAVLPLPITTLVSAGDLAPSPVDRMLGSAGIAFINPQHAATAYPELWSNRECAKKAMERWHTGQTADLTNDKSSWGHFLIRDILIRKCPQLTRKLYSFEYKLAGARQKAATAWCDPAMVSDPVASVVALLRLDLVQHRATKAAPTLMAPAIACDKVVVDSDVTTEVDPSRRGRTPLLRSEVVA
jgi:putative DNA primase/helicase